MAAALAGLFVMMLAPRLTIPVVVVELLIGILIGPQVLDLAQVDPTTDFLGNLGLGMLFFFAGYEIDFERIKGRTDATCRDRLAAFAGARLQHRRRAGRRRSCRLLPLHRVGDGDDGDRDLIPILKDAGETRTKFGTYLLGAGAAGEFGPILLVTLILSTTHPVHEALILILFVALAASPACSPFARPGRVGR